MRKIKIRSLSLTPYKDGLRKTKTFAILIRSVRVVTVSDATPLK